MDCYIHGIARHVIACRSESSEGTSQQISVQRMIVDLWRRCVVVHASWRGVKPTSCRWPWRLYPFILMCWILEGWRSLTLNLTNMLFVRLTLLSFMSPVASIHRGASAWLCTWVEHPYTKKCTIKTVYPCNTMHMLHMQCIHLCYTLHMLLVSYIHILLHCPLKNEVAQTPL